jgi:hypothetical protein
MKINGLTVCVNYSEYLRLGIERWLSGLQSLVVVTDRNDKATQALCRAYGVKCHRTDVFYAHGAMFNKGAAIEEARQLMPWRDWILFFDSDIVPERAWYPAIVNHGCTPGRIYGAPRRACSDPSKIDKPTLPTIQGDGIAIGYFQLFHSRDPAVQSAPIVPTDFRHAGVYDSLFKDRWPAPHRQHVPVRLAHLGETRRNWCGVGNRRELDKIFANRTSGGVPYCETERIDQ